MKMAAFPFANGLIVGLLAGPFWGFGRQFWPLIMILFDAPIHRAIATAAGFGSFIASWGVFGLLSLPLPVADRPPPTVCSVNLAAFATVVFLALSSACWRARLAHALHPTSLQCIYWRLSVGGCSQNDG